jgi:hypothetical protein
MASGLADHRLGHHQKKRSGSSKVDFNFIDVAPAPGFAGFDRAHDGVSGVMEMLGGVFVFGRVAAADMPAFHAQTQVNPSVAHFKAFLAAFGARRYFVNVTQMSTSGHTLSPVPIFDEPT